MSEIIENSSLKQFLNMKTLRLIQSQNHLFAGVLFVLALYLVAYPASAATEQWQGVPGVSATTNWTDANNWTAPKQTYYNQVQFTGNGANANSDFSVNNVLDSATGVAQMPIWELDYASTNGNYTTLVNPGVTLNLNAGRGYLIAGADQLHTGSPAPANAFETFTITGAGATLSMAGNLYVCQGSPTPGDTHNVTLDLSGLDNFTITNTTGSEILVASAGAPRTHGTLYLAKTNQISLGNDFQICNQSYSNSLPCAVYLGQTNTILTGTGNLIVAGTGTTMVGAWMKFNPAFLGGANPPMAYLGGTASDGRIVNFFICNANGGPQVPGYGLCDFSGGNVMLFARTMQLGQGGNAGANALGVLALDDGVIDVNNATIGNQEVSSGGTGVGVVNLNTNSVLGTNGALRVNSTLTLAATTGTLTPGTVGTININGGALTAKNIVRGGGTGSLNMTNATFTLTGTAGTPSTPISSLTLINSTLNLAVVASATNIEVASLATGGATNIVNITVVPPSPSYPVQVPLIKYQGSLGGSGYNFGVGTLPPLCSGYLSNNIANASIDLVLTAGPVTYTWTGAVSGNWDTSTTNWLAGSTPTAYSDGGFPQFQDGAITGTVNLTAAVSPDGVTVSNNVLGYTFNGSGNISGTGALLKQGTGTLVLDNVASNSFSGGVTISGGILQVGNNDSSGNLPPGAVVNNSVLVFDHVNNIAINNAISGSGAVVQEGGDVLLLSGANSFANQVVVTNASVLQLGSSSALGVGGSNVVIASGSTLDANGYSATKPIVVSGTGVSGNGAIIDSGGAIYDNPGPGLATNIMLAGDTTFLMNSPSRWDLGSSSGGSVLGALGAYNLTLNGNGGYFEWRNLSVQSPLANITIASGTLGVVGTTTFGNPSATLVLTSGASLQFYGANVFVNKQVDFQSGANIINSSGANVMNGAMTMEPGFCTVNVANGTTLNFSNVLSGSGVFYQTPGTGTAILSGNSPSFTGGVLLYSGQLTLNGLIGSGITSQPGTTITGTGTANGLVDVSGTLMPGRTGVAGTFNAGGGLTLQGSASVTMNLSSTTAVGGGTNSLVAVTGDLTVNGNNILLNPIKGTLASGTYRLFTYTGNLNGSFGTAATIAPSRYTFSLDTNTPHQVNLIVSGQSDLLVWNNGANNGQWDVASSLNWTNLTTHTNDQFLIPDAVVLDDSITNAAHPTTSLTVAASTVVIPNVLTNYSTTNYTLAGAGKISGGASVVKLGSSTLTITMTNDFTGSFTIGAGTVKANGLTAALGATNSPLVISNGATLIMNCVNSYPAGDAGFGNKPIIVSGAGNGSGAIQFIGSTPLYSDASTFGLGQNITLTGNTTLSGAARFDWGYPGAGTTLSTGGSNYNLTVSVGGYSQWYDIGIDTNLGNVDLYTSASSQQTLRIQALGTSLGNPTNILTLHSNILFNIQHGDINAADSGYAKVVHILGTAAWQYQPSGAGDYRLNTSFILETNAGLYFFNGNGGTNSGTVINGSVLLNGLANFQVGNSLVTFSNVISGTGGFYLNQYSGFPLVFAAANTYQGITDIRANMALALIGNGSISQSTPISLAAGAMLIATNRVDGTLTLASGQTLQGSGIVNGMLAASAGSTIAPGTSAAVGTLTVSNTTTLGGNALFKLNNTNSDVLNVAGSIAYGGTLTLTNISATPLAAGSSFKLFNGASYTGAFSSIVTAPPLAAGLAWNTKNLLTTGTISVTQNLTFTGINVSGTTLTLTATNGPAGGTFVLLETTNLTVPVSQWTAVLTNTFDGSGNLNLSTNIVNPSNAQEFYMLSQ
jgi:fibronectin-binding autotransporter adhesin